MLKEITNLNQTSDNLNRRWFSGEGLDLYLWQDTNGAVTQFQFSYNKPDERVVLWTRKDGLSRHSVISENTSPYHMDASAVFGAPSDWPLQEARDLFIRHAQHLEHAVYEFILDKLGGKP